MLTIVPGTGGSAGSVLTGLAGSSSGLLSESDLHTVRKTTGISYAAPLATVSGSMTGDHTVNNPFIIATNTDFPQIINQPMAAGGFFDPQSGSQTVVLGSTAAQQLFNDNAPLGQGLTWRGQRFIVAGVFAPFNAPPFSLEANFDDAVFVPYSTAQTLSGSVLGIYRILAKSSTVRDAGSVAQSLNAALVSAHGGAQDVTVSTAGSGNGTSDQTIHLLTLLISGAAIIALVVGGVGIMDVMLVSVTERMHEIGLRKAIGATNRQIMRQFVAEAFVLSSIGAVAGVALACAGVGLLRAYTSLQAVLVWQALVAAPLIAIAVGLFFGSMPALKAARKDPIEALRHE